MSVTPETRFITLCTREPGTVRPRAIASAAAAVRDWDAVVGTATRHRVAAFLQQAAARHAVSLPPQADHALRGAALAALSRVMVLDGELVRTVRALAAAQIPVIVLKGPALARTIYPVAALRPYGDIDALVQERNEMAAVAALTGCGFREVPFALEHATRLRGGEIPEAAAFHREFVSASGQALVELHLDPLQLGLKPACEAARWRRAVPVPGLPGAQMLCPEDQLVQLSVHAHKHGFGRLIWLKDLDLLLRAHGDRLDWHLVAAVAGEEGVSASVWYSLRLAAVMLGAPVPRPLLTHLRPAAPVQALYRAIWPLPRIAALDGRPQYWAVQFHLAGLGRGMLPSIILMGRRRDRARAVARSVLHRRHAPTGTARPV